MNKLRALGLGNEKTEYVRHWWRQRTLRWQLLATFAAITLMATLGAAFLLVLDARHRALAETSAALQIAEEFVRTASSNVSSKADAARVLAQITEQFKHGRHVKVIPIPFGSADGLGGLETRRTSSFDQVNAGRSGSSLMDLIGIEREVRTVGIRVGDALVANVILTGQPSDEFEEAWTGLKTIGLIWIGTNTAIFAILYFVLGRVLQPLSSVALGMEKLETEQAGVRVMEPKAIELRRVVSSFNHLAENLERARHENHLLFRQVMEVQEKERRRIAGELHDEIGPCLFGIMTCVTSVAKLTEHLPAELRKKADDRIGELGEICNRLKQSNRSILNRLYPIAAGHITIRQLLEKLLREYRQRYLDIAFVDRIGQLQRSYGEERDLLLYRAVQEGVTNAMRHGRAMKIVVSLRHRSPDDITTPLVLEIEDDGVGLSENFELGFGLTTMKMRLQACGGSLSIDGATPKGVLIRLVVPTETGNGHTFLDEAGRTLQFEGASL